MPFCPESELSGVNHKDFMAAVWYRRSFSLTDEAVGKRILLHFGAVDYKCEVWLNGKSVGMHEGGYVSFAFDVTAAVQSGENTIVVCAEDDLRHGRQPYDKQSRHYHSYGCSYTRTTGIWQTVWLEWMNPASIKSARMYPDAANGSLYLDELIEGLAGNLTLKAEASFDGVPDASVRVRVNGSHAKLTIRVERLHLWGPGEGNLYDLKLMSDDTVIDEVDSYFALRTISFDGKKCLINGKPVFQRLVLDQGFYPQGIYTAPSDEALRGDIEMSMAMGFNGARLHQKVFEQRYHYWADRLGYLCWGEMANWGIDPARPHTMNIFLREWLEVVERDFNASCIIGWCPYNEVWRESNDGLRELTLMMTYRVTKAADPTRPCIDTSGGFHTETDIYDIHDYDQDPAVLRVYYPHNGKLFEPFEGRQQCDGKAPMFVSEYGGIRWSDDANSWGYGAAPTSPEEFIARYEGLTQSWLDVPDHMGFCYIQLTDVEQEQNGLYTYDRKPKFDPHVIAEINRRPAAMEQT